MAPRKKTAAVIEPASASSEPEPVAVVSATSAPIETVAHVAAIEKPKVCKTCGYWAHLGMDPILGQCMRSRRAMPSPMMTTDMMSCSGYEAK